MMSHFTVLVALDKSVDITPTDAGDRPGLEFALDQALERFDEGRDVEPYREYLIGEPANFWWVKECYQVRNHGDSASNIFQPHRYHGWADRLDQGVTVEGDLSWSHVIGLYGLWSIENGHNVDIFYDEDEDRAYEVSTYNPQGKWDWWAIGGRWSGQLLATSEHEPNDVIPATNVIGWNAPKRDDWEGRIDGGRVRYVDLERMRSEAVESGLRLHRQYHELRARHGEGYREWSSFLADVEAEKLDITTARELYRNQPFKMALNNTEEFRFWFADLDVEMSVSEEDYAAEKRRGAVTCYSTLTKEGVWMEPGQMGWFGMSSDTRESREAYDVEVNSYLSSLDPDDIIVVIDCHI
jgi:hypothetical protein